MSRQQIILDAAPSHRAWLRALRPPLPREHGTWAWLLVPALSGLLALGWPTLPGWLVFGSGILGFFLRSAIENWQASQPREARYLAWAVILLIGLHLTAVPAATHWDRWALLPLGVGIVLGPMFVRAIRPLRVRRRALGEGVVVGSLSLLAPAVAYASSGEFDRWTGFLWLPVALYLWGSITYVRMSLASASQGAARLQQERRRAAVLYHAGLVPALAAAVVGGAVPALATLAFVPMTGKVMGALRAEGRVVRVTRLGIWEAIHAGVFTALLITLYRLAG